MQAPKPSATWLAGHMPVAPAGGITQLPVLALNISPGGQVQTAAMRDTTQPPLPLASWPAGQEPVAPAGGLTVDVVKQPPMPSETWPAGQKPVAPAGG